RLVGPVAREAAPGEDRPDLRHEADRLLPGLVAPSGLPTGQDPQREKGRHDDPGARNARHTQAHSRRQDTRDTHPRATILTEPSRKGCESPPSPNDGPGRRPRNLADLTGPARPGASSFHLVA